MRIALDARAIYDNARRGIGKTSLQLYRGIASAHPEWEFVMFRRAGKVEDPFADVINVRSQEIEMCGDRWGLWQELRLPLAARSSGAGVLHCPANTGPGHPLLPMVLTIHDLIPLEAGNALPEAPKWGSWVRTAARKARRILVPSSYTAGRIVELFAVSEDRIVVSPWAAADNCKEVTDREQIERVLSHYGMPGGRPYVFGFGGGDDTRKNTRRVLEAWASLPATLRAQYALLLVGIGGPSLEPIRRQASELGLEHVLLHGFADEADLPALISGADVLCYPSLSEGFGLPVLDGFACGTAVLTSNVTSLPEVAGDAAVLVDPRDSQAIGRALQQLLSDEALRRGLVARGRERCKRFTWKACVDTVGRVLEEAACS